MSEQPCDDKRGHFFRSIDHRSYQCYRCGECRQEKDPKEAQIEELERIIAEYKYRDKAAEIMSDEACDNYEKEIARLQSELEEARKEIIARTKELHEKEKIRGELDLQLSVANEKIEKTRAELKRIGDGHHKSQVATLGEKVMIHIANEALAALGEKRV